MLLFLAVLGNQKMATYEEARATAAAAFSGEFTLPSYTGGQADLPYLRTWVLDQVTALYAVTADVFDQATIYSTSILRDFVHRAIYQSTTHEDIDVITANGDLLYAQNSDVATAFRYPATGLCGLMAWQEYQVFRAFGYETHEIATMSGDVDTFTDSHVMTEVYLSDLGKFIIQDATFNVLLKGNDGTPLSYDGVRDELYLGDGDLTFDSFNNYRDYHATGTFATTIAADLQALFEDRYFKTPQWWYETDGRLTSLTANLFPSAATAHDPASDQGGEYTSVADAFKAVGFLKGSHWLSVADLVRDSGHYASGFALTDDSGNITSRWVTVRTADGEYLSFDIDRGTALRGSLDQLMNTATGGPDLNPSADLSAFINPFYMVDYEGRVLEGYGLSPQSSQTFDFEAVILRNKNTGAVKIWDAPDGSNLNNGATLSPTSDTGFKIIGTGDYMGNDGAFDILFQKAATGQVGMWDDHASFRSLGSMAAAWKMVSQDDFSDFTADGSDDILWHNSSTGAVGYWDLVAGTNQGFTSIGAVSAALWSIVATGDMNGDGMDDVVWKNNSTSEIREWLIGANGQVAQNLGLWGQANSSVIGTADLTHDGSADILLRNASTGEVGFFDILNGQNTGYHLLGTVNTAWNVAAVRDITADSTPDILWETPTGQLYLWNLDQAGSVLALDQYLGAHASDWLVA